MNLHSKLNKVGLFSQSDLSGCRINWLVSMEARSAAASSRTKTLHEFFQTESKARL